MNMEYQRFIPEGWEKYDETVSSEQIVMAKDTGAVMQGFVTKCDQNFNLHVNLGNNITGIVPREEVEEFNIDENGLPKPSICINKVNKIIQFKVKDIADENLILSRRSVGEEAIKWVKEELNPRTSIKRNSKKCSKLWCFYRNRRRSSRTFTYRRYVCC